MSTEKSKTVWPDPAEVAAACLHDINGKRSCASVRCSVQTRSKDCHAWPSRPCRVRFHPFYIKPQVP